jgi:hypothetical protein
MNMSRFILLAGVAGLCASGCSSPAEEGEPDPAPTTPPPGFLNGTLGQGGASGQQVGQAGTGGTGVLPTAGTGGAPAAAAGTGGAPVAAAGTGGAGGAPSTIPTGTGNLIMHDGTGWVPGGSNGLGIQGSFYPFSDMASGGVTTVTMGDFAASPTSACASGSASQVQMGNFGMFWGGGIGLNLADAGNMMGAIPWNRGTVTGFSFTITGPTIPPGEQMRFKVTTFEGGAANDSGYCVTAAPGANTFTFDELIAECWGGGVDLTALADTVPIVSLQWQVATTADGPTDFNFCIENLTAVTTP